MNNHSYENAGLLVGFVRFIVWESSNLRDLSDSGNFTDNFLDGRERMPLRSGDRENIMKV